MRSLGLSFDGSRLFAVLRDQTPLGGKGPAVCDVPHRAPISSEDAAGLAEAVRKLAGGSALPPAVLSLPPSWTFVRHLELPVQDLARARKIHPAELDGELPINEEETLSDLLPPPGGDGNRFIAVATRRSELEKLVGTLEEGGIRIGRVVTDHAAILAVLADVPLPPECLLVSFLSDIVVMKLSNGRPSLIRQFPSGLAASRSAWSEAWAGVQEAAGAGLPVLTIGRVPEALLPDIQGAGQAVAPTDTEPEFLPALGACLSAFDRKATEGFSLRTSMDVERDRRSERRRIRIAIAAAVVAAVSGLFALQAAIWSESKRVEAVRSRIRSEFAEAAPDIKNIVQPSAQIRERIETLRRQRRDLGGETEPPSAWLSKISQALPAGESLAVRDVSIEGGKARLSGDGKTADAVEKYRSSLAASFGSSFSVSIQLSEGTSRDGGRRFTILIEQKVNGRVS